MVPGPVGTEKRSKDFLEKDWQSSRKGTALEVELLGAVERVKDLLEWTGKSQGKGTCRRTAGSKRFAGRRESNRFFRRDWQSLGKGSALALR